MQSIFSYERSKGSGYIFARDMIAKAFSPDLNSMEVQNKELLKVEKKEALALFSEYYLQKKEVNASSKKRINDVVNDCITRYYDDLKKDKKRIEKLMVDEAEGLTNKYVLVLILLTEFAHIAGTDNKHNTDNFVNNAFIKAIKFNKSLENIILKRKLSWTGLNDELREWYRDTIRSTDEYQSYLKIGSPNLAQDKQAIEFLIKGIIFKNEIVTGYMEEKDLYWSENKSIIKSMVLKTIKTIESEEEFELAQLSYNWEEDKEFFINTYQRTLELDEEYKDLIGSKTINWDIDRLASVDLIIMEMAISEMLNFRSIPIKVTINEYIELAKNYSTPKSKQFINGVLDNISKELTDNGKIRKSGRGLIDNK